MKSGTCSNFLLDVLIQDTPHVRAPGRPLTTKVAMNLKIIFDLLLDENEWSARSKVSGAMRCCLHWDRTLPVVCDRRRCHGRMKEGHESVI